MMHFEIEHALRDLDERSPVFLKLEALAAEDEQHVKENALVALTCGADRRVVRLLRDLLRAI